MNASTAQIDKPLEELSETPLAARYHFDKQLRQKLKNAGIKTIFLRGNKLEIN